MKLRTSKIQRQCGYSDRNLENFRVDLNNALKRIEELEEMHENLSVDNQHLVNHRNQLLSDVSKILTVLGNLMEQYNNPAGCIREE